MDAYAPLISSPDGEEILNRRRAMPVVSASLPWFGSHFLPLRTFVHAADPRACVRPLRMVRRGNVKEVVWIELKSETRSPI